MWIPRLTKRFIKKGVQQLYLYDHYERGPTIDKLKMNMYLVPTVLFGQWKSSGGIQRIPNVNPQAGITVTPLPMSIFTVEILKI